MTSRQWFVTAAALSLTVGTTLAQTQSTTLSSATTFQLRGAVVNPSTAIPGWPIAPGDAFKAGDTPLTMVLQDDSTVVFAPKAEASLRGSGDVLVVRLESGSGHYTLKPESRVRFQCKDTAIAMTGLTGDVHCGGHKVTTALWLAGGTALAADVVGVAVSKGNGPPVSPTKCNNGNGRGNGLPPCP